MTLNRSYNSLSLESNNITNLATPFNANDAANKNYVDTADILRVLKAGDTMGYVLNMNNNTITDVPNPINDATWLVIMVDYLVI